MANSPPSRALYSHFYPIVWQGLSRLLLVWSIVAMHESLARLFAADHMHARVAIRDNSKFRKTTPSRDDQLLLSAQSHSPAAAIVIALPVEDTDAHGWPLGCSHEVCGTDQPRSTLLQPPLGMCYSSLPAQFAIFLSGAEIAVDIIMC